MLCIQCHVRPATVSLGLPYCSKTCANAKTGGSSTKNPSVMNKAKGMIAGGPPNSPGHQNKTPVVQVMPLMGMQTTVQKTQQRPMMVATTQPVVVMQQTPQGMSPRPVQQPLQVLMVQAGPPPSSQNCAIIGCPKKAIVDASTVTPGKYYFCMAHRKLGETCQFPSCGKPVYTDPKTGNKAQFCSRSHASAMPGNTQPTVQPMEQSIGQMPYLPGSSMSNNNSTWPTICQWADCGKPIWVDPTGKPSKYCGKAHMNAAKAKATTPPISVLGPIQIVPNPQLSQMRLIQALNRQSSSTAAFPPYTNFLMSGRQLGSSGKFALIICDMQEEYRQNVHQFSSVLATAIRMIRLAEIFRIPVFITTVWSSIYGLVVPEIHQQLSFLSDGNAPNDSFIDTESFGSSKELVDKLKSNNVSHAIICGVEAHIAVESQARVLTTNGIAVHIIADGISSSNKEETPLSLIRLRKLDKTSISTSESVAFYLMESLAEQMEETERRQFKLEFLTLITTEKRSIANGLKKLLGEGDSQTDVEDSEALE